MTTDLTTPELLDLERAALDAQATATSPDAPADAMEQWRKAVAAVQAAVAAHAKKITKPRVDVEMAVKKAVRHSAEDAED
ncbi:hypothetical protein [Streptomyces bacillaris]|uniref:hypothetical protein n=1 Tax=Streptomyces bacillaris TaxID=68179 RepID=UPI0036446CF1